MGEGSRRHGRRSRPGDAGTSPAAEEALTDVSNRAAAGLQAVLDGGGPPGALDEVVSGFRTVVAATPTDHRQFSSRLSNLGLALLTRFRRGGDPADLDAGIAHSAQAVSACRATNPQRGMYLANLGVALTERFDQRSSVADLDEAIDCGEQAVLVTAAGHPNRAGYVRDLGVALQRRTTHHRGPGDLDRAVVAAETALDATPPDHPDRIDRLHQLGTLLRQRWTHEHQESDFDRAIDLAEQAVAAGPADQQERATYLSIVGLELRMRYLLERRPADLDREVQVTKLAASAAPVQHPMRPQILGNFHRALWTRYELGADAEDLDLLVEVGWYAIAEDPAGDLDRGELQGRQARAVLLHHAVPSRSSDVDRAVTVLERAARDAGRPDRSLTVVIHSLGLAVQQRFDRFGDPLDLRRAVELGEWAVALLPATDPDRGTVLSNLAMAFTSCYRRLGAPADLDRAVELGEQSVEAPAIDASTRAARLSNLALTLRARFELTGDAVDLDRAVDVGEQAVAVSPAHEPDRLDYLANLGLVLRVRYYNEGHPADLDRAIEVGEQAVATDTPTVAAVSNLGLALHARHDRAGRLADLDRAIGLLAQAVARHSGPATLSNLGLALTSRATVTRRPDDVDRAIEVLRAAIAETPVDHPDRPGYLSNLARAAQVRFGVTEDPADLDLAVDVGAQAAGGRPTDHPEQAAVLLDLGLGLLARAVQAGDAHGMAEAEAAFRSAARIRTAPMPRRLEAAAAWGSAAAERKDWASAADGFATAIELLPLALHRRLPWTFRQDLLRTMKELGSDAAACCLQLGQVTRAIELWEQGRGVLFGETLDVRTDLARLAAAHPRLAAAFDAVWDELSAATAAGPPPSTGETDGSPDHQVDRLRELSAELDRQVAGIRALPTFERFQLPPSIDELQQAAEHGPVVMVNLSKYRCDALLLTSSGAAVVPLPDLTSQDAHIRMMNLFIAVEGHRTCECSPAIHAENERTLGGTLDWLWRVVAEPVLDRLGIIGPPDGQEWPRLWWCASGSLTLLPLHAAGRREPVAQSVLDRVVSSYTPSVRALLHARRGATARGAEGPTGVLVVAMPETPAAQALPAAAAEARLLTGLFGERATVLSGPAATHQRVAAALRDARWAHFACHAETDQTDPSAGRLLLHDHEQSPLTVLDLTRLRLDDAELAFLSACRTARADPHLADEAIHLAGACQVAGFRHVIATLWPVGDRSTARFSGAVYRVLAEDDVSSAAVAVHRAVRAQRDRSPDRPSVWAAHVHYGG